jgi:hypothetical protein
LRVAKGLLLATRAKVLSLGLLESIAAVAACSDSICFSFSFTLLNLFIVFKLQQTMSLPFDLRKDCCFLRQRMWKALSNAVY